MICDRPTQVLRENRGKPKVDYCLKPKQWKVVMKWMKDLKFPDGHDFHITMERLMPIMFHGYISDVVWKTLAEVSYFYRQLCVKEIRRDVMEQPEKEALVLLCKLEKIFPPGFFNPMHHLFIHLRYEAKVGGPV
jgi:hypothetical protein